MPLVWFVGLFWLLVTPPLLLCVVVKRKPAWVIFTGPFYASYTCLVLLVYFLLAGHYGGVLAICFAAPPLCGFAWRLARRRLDRTRRK